MADEIPAQPEKPHIQPPQEQSVLPRISFEGAIGLLLAVIVGILDHLHVSEPVVVWGLFAFGLVLISDSILRSKWVTSTTDKKERWRRRALGMVPVIIAFGCFGVWIYVRREISAKQTSDVSTGAIPPKAVRSSATQTAAQMARWEKIFLHESVEQIEDTLRGKTQHERHLIVHDKYFGKWVKESFIFLDLETPGDEVRVTLSVPGKVGLEQLQYPPIVAFMGKQMLPRLTHLKPGETLTIQGQVYYWDDLELDLVNAEALDPAQSPVVPSGASVSVANSPGAVVAPIQNSPNATQNLTVNQAPKRSVSPEQADKMKSILVMQSGYHVQISSILGDSDGMDFRNQLDEVFRSAGWATSLGTVMTFDPWKGIHIEISTNDIPADVMTRAARDGGHTSLSPSEIPYAALVVAGAIKQGLGETVDLGVAKDAPSGYIHIEIGYRK